MVNISYGFFNPFLFEVLLRSITNCGIAIASGSYKRSNHKMWPLKITIIFFWPKASPSPIAQEWWNTKLTHQVHLSQPAECQAALTFAFMSMLHLIRPINNLKTTWNQRSKLSLCDCVYLILYWHKVFSFSKEVD